MNKVTEKFIKDGIKNLIKYSDSRPSHYRTDIEFIVSYNGYHIGFAIKKENLFE